MELCDEYEGEETDTVSQEWSVVERDWSDLRGTYIYVHIDLIAFFSLSSSFATAYRM